MRLNGFRVRQRPPIRHSGEGGNPRTMTARQYVDRKTGSSCHDQRSAGACPQPPAGPPYLPRRMAGVPPHTNVLVGAIRESPWGGAWQKPPCQFAVSSHNSSFSYLGVPAPAGMSDCYESTSRTTIRDRPLRRPVFRDSRHPIVNPAPNSSFRRRPESRGAGMRKCSAWARPQLRTGRPFAQVAPTGVPPFLRPYVAFARPW